MAKNRKHKSPHKRRLAAISRSAEIRRTEKPQLDKEALELLRGATRQVVPLLQKFHSQYKIKLEKTGSPLLRVALAFHNYRFLNEPWTITRDELNPLLPVIKEELGDEHATVLSHLAALLDYSSPGTEEPLPSHMEPLLRAAYQFHGITYRATSGLERQAFLQDGIDALANAELLLKRSVRGIVAKVGAILKARSPTTQTVRKSLQAIETALGEMDANVIMEISPVLSALGLYITRITPSLLEDIGNFKHLRRHVLERNSIIDSREVPLRSPEGINSLGRFLPYFLAETDGLTLSAEVHLKAAILKFRYSLMTANDGAANDALIEINHVLGQIQLAEGDRDKIKLELANSLVSTLMQSSVNEDGRRKIDTTVLLEHNPLDYRLCCLKFLFDRELPASTEFTNFDKEVFIWVVSQLKLKQRQVFVATFYSTLSAGRKREVLNSAINYSIHQEIRGDALWQTFVGPMIRGEYNEPPILISTMTPHLASSFNLAVLWAEYEGDKFARRVPSLSDDVLVAVSHGIAELLNSFSDLHDYLTGHLLKRRWKAFLPVLYQEGLLARVGKLAFCETKVLVDDVIVFLDEELKKHGVTLRVAQACLELHKLEELSNPQRIKLKALHEKTAHALKLKSDKAA